MKPDLLNSLLQVETATLGHAITEGFMTPAMQCATSEKRCCGPALTVSLPGDDGYSLPLALLKARPGDVLVIERLNDDRHACWGAVMTEAALQAGISAVVLDGYITDIGAVRAAGLAVWCKGRSPVTTKAGKTGGSVNQTVTCDGVRVGPGDIVLADENGVVVLAPEQAEALAAQALEIQARELPIIERIRLGESLASIYYGQQ
uniref:RraA family protein n=1 Tax=Marinobacterium profundum TaxID=1714300 RepID=UPI00082BA1B0|nr:RraA family protein [Marinobacterium profundum]